MKWQEVLRLHLQNLNPQKDRIAVVGIGNEMRGDDGAGVLVTRALRARLHSSQILLIDAGVAPENCTGALRRFQPAFVLLIDSAQMGETAGAVRLLDCKDVEGLSASTHTLPLSLLADYLLRELGCAVLIVGIQPRHMRVGAPLSLAVQYVVDTLIKQLCALWEE